MPGVSTASYVPYCFFNLASPVLDLLSGFSGFKVPSSPPASAGREEERPVDQLPAGTAPVGGTG